MCTGTAVKASCASRFFCVGDGLCLPVGGSCRVCTRCVASCAAPVVFCVAGFSTRPLMHVGRHTRLVLFPHHMQTAIATRTLHFVRGLLILFVCVG